jgi:Family of unknown function (DUF5675)
MQITVRRQVFTEQSTVGQMFINGKFECFTLEDRVRPAKIKSETAISAGTYQLVINVSARFGIRLPLLVDVPEFSGIRIHPGNAAADTDGCILVGQNKSADFVGSSKLAFQALMPKLEKAAALQKITIEIINDGTPIGMAATTTSRSRGGPPRLAAPVELGTPYQAAKQQTAAKQPVAKKAAAKKAVTQKSLSKSAPAKNVVHKVAGKAAPKAAPKPASKPARQETRKAAGKK